MKVVYIDIQNKIIKKENINNEEDLILRKEDLVFKSPKAVGNKIIGANRIQVYSNNKKSSSGGHFANSLKCNGYDYLIIKNKSENPIYIYINKDSILLHDAREIWDKDFDLIEAVLKKNLNNENIEIAQIGLAGINKLDFSKIMFKNNKSLGKNGLGKLMGEKNLKAIVLNKIDNKQVDDLEDFNEINLKIANKISNSNIEDYFKEENKCYGCCLNCESSVVSKILKHNFNEDEAKLINDISNKYGMDSISISKVISNLKEYEEFKDKTIDEIVNFIIYNKEYKNLIKKFEENKTKDKYKKEKNNLEETLEDLGFCKFLIKKNILDEKEIEILTSKI